MNRRTLEELCRGRDPASLPVEMREFLARKPPLREVRTPPHDSSQVNQSQGIPTQRLGNTQSQIDCEAGRGAESREGQTHKTTTQEDQQTRTHSQINLVQSNPVSSQQIQRVQGSRSSFGTLTAPGGVKFRERRWILKRVSSSRIDNSQYQKLTGCIHKNRCGEA